ncbi:MAG: nucleotidyltransferase family protein [Clostridia bacterium]|nr:nucleotidyltransferase family protein [Clostridia bacterium]
MSAAVGIVAEYDPFHRGHEKHLRLARERAGADTVYVALSGCFRQRGDPAMLSPWDRAECALAAGADAVFLLPTAWTVRDAEHYALGAVALLARLGATYLAFGAEYSDPQTLFGIAEKLEAPADAFRDRLRAALAAGNGYPRALNMAMAAENALWSEILSRPNNILAVSYLRAIRRLRLPLQPVVIPREGAYRAETIDPECPSASAIRAAVERGDYEDAFRALPPESRRVIRKALLDRRLPDPSVLDHLTIRTLRSMGPAEAEASLTDLSEGLSNRILREAGRAGSRKELLDRVCTRRYPRARVNRILTRALLGLTDADGSGDPSFRDVLLLGMKPRPDMTAAWKDRDVRIHTGVKTLPPDPAFGLWGQCAGLGADWAFRQKMVTGS